ncbi:hypothetical protein SRHO_G00065820 [Serrasalmus rhombeus]
MSVFIDHMLQIQSGWCSGLLWFIDLPCTSPVNRRSCRARLSSCFRDLTPRRSWKHDGLRAATPSTSPPPGAHASQGSEHFETPAAGIPLRGAPSSSVLDGLCNVGHWAS